MRSRASSGLSPTSAMDSARRIAALGATFVLLQAALAARIPTTVMGASPPGQSTTARGWSGWSQVPGGELTPDAPGPITYGDFLYLFARGTDQTIRINRYDGSRWRGWREVPGKVLTESGPGAVVYRKSLYVVVRGTDDGIWVNRYNGSRWRGWREVPGNIRQDPWPPPGVVTLTSPGAVVYKERLYVFVRDANHPHHVIWANRYNGSQWRGWRQVPGNFLTPTAPDAVGHKRALYIVVRRGDEEERSTPTGIWVNRYNGSKWRGWREIPGKGLTRSAPGAVNYKRRLYVIVRGTDDAIRVNHFNGSQWRGWRKVPGTRLTEAGPDGATYRGVLHLFVTGTDKGIYVNKLRR